MNWYEMLPNQQIVVGTSYYKELYIIDRKSKSVIKTIYKDL